MAGSTSRKNNKNKKSNYRIVTNADKAAAKKARAEHRQPDTASKSFNQHAKKQKNTNPAVRSDKSEKLTRTKQPEEVKPVVLPPLDTAAESVQGPAVEEEPAAEEKEAEIPSFHDAESKEETEESIAEKPQEEKAETPQPSKEEQKETEVKESSDQKKDEPVSSTETSDKPQKPAENPAAEESSPAAQEKKEAEIPSFKEAEKKQESKPVYFRTITKDEIETNFVTEYEDKPARINPLKRIVDPVSCMLAQAVSGIHKNAAHALWLIILKYCLIGLASAFAMSRVLNTEPFSFARMTFSDASYFFIRIAGLGFISEMLISLVRGLLGARGISLEKYRRYLDITGEASISIGIVYAIASLLMIHDFVFGVGGYIVAIAVSSLLHGYAYEFAYRCGRRRALLAELLAAILAVVLAFCWINLTGADLLRILRSFIDF